MPISANFQRFLTHWNRYGLIIKRGSVFMLLTKELTYQELQQLVLKPGESGALSPYSCLYHNLLQNVDTLSLHYKQMSVLLESN